MNSATTIKHKLLDRSHLNIRFLTPYFPPELGAAQVRISELAVRLMKMGHSISVLTTFPNYPSGVVPPEWRGKLFWKGTQDGIQTYRVWSYATPNRGFLNRILGHLCFAVCSALAGLMLPRCDLLVVESPPLFDGFAARALSFLRRTPYLFMVSDLWPESAIQMGVLKNRTLIKASRQIERSFYRSAVGVLALTKGIREKIIASGIEAEKVFLFRNSVDCDFFSPQASTNTVRSELKVDTAEWLIVYAGTFGLAQNLTTLLHTASLLQADGEHVRFVFAGDGAEFDRVKSEAESIGVKNVILLPSQPKRRVPDLLNAADCIVVPLRDLEIFRGALPTKMFEGMACGKPILLGVRGEAEEVVMAADAGYCVTPDDPHSYKNAALQMMRNRAEAEQRGRNGRQYALQHFTREVRARELIEFATQRLNTTRANSN